MFAEHGVNEVRIKMIPGLPFVDFLKIHNEIDIALDPFPFNGLFTTCDSLWMGVPVITLCGKIFAGRMGASLMTRIGFPESIAEDKKEYVNKAVSLADNISILNDLRTKTRQKLCNSPICDISKFIQTVESAYFKMWENYCVKKNQTNA